MSMPLPLPDLVARDPDTVGREIVEAFEIASGRTLQPGQVERLLLNALAYRESLIRIQIEHVARQNLVAFAHHPMLDYLGELVGVERLAASAASAELRFEIAGVQAFPVVIPAGTLVQSRDGAVSFATIASVVIPPGQVDGTAVARSITPGRAGNGYAPGTLAALPQPISFVRSVSNLEETAGGADVEDDERLRVRIREAPQTFSVAGSAGAYRAHAVASHPDVVDVAVDSPAPGKVRLSVLALGGAAPAPVLAAVLAATSAETVRPLTDTVEVVPATRVQYSIRATLSFEAGADPSAAYAAARSAAEQYAAAMRRRLGQGVIPSQVIAVLSVPGVRRVVLEEPEDIEVSEISWADCVTIELLIAPVNV